MDKELVSRMSRIELTPGERAAAKLFSDQAVLNYQRENTRAQAIVAAAREELAASQRRFDAVVLMLLRFRGVEVAPGEVLTPEYEAGEVVAVTTGPAQAAPAMPAPMPALAPRSPAPQPPALFVPKT